jgi:hypothetical protein
VYNGWTLAEAVEAHFGRYRVLVSGADYRAFYTPEGARRCADFLRGRGRDAEVVDSHERPGKRKGVKRWLPRCG